MKGVFTSDYISNGRLLPQSRRIFAQLTLTQWQLEDILLSPGDTRWRLPDSELVQSGPDSELGSEVAGEAGVLPRNVQTSHRQALLQKYNYAFA